MANPKLFPETCSSLLFKEIVISNVPATCPTTTEVILLILNRPKRFNAVTESMLEEIITAHRYFDADDRVKAIVITGAGPSFCVGADLEVGFSKLVKNLKQDPSSIGTYRDG
ncbi:hypothetical protein Z517_08243 [Fonsecaea pedrosoi CBS 271.37]|uniref:Enoyl-CoA hydratase n=1 Tax=Fonsecaea pedrosoi CBS 271.37 TaxID=1442368 RepID=A0A0D2EVZ0_9EURO|nr:uncharacterized protein Z517_08243 [Fonsecaea pedrosoi CBS 271.37]KIW78407.1 hypothetical protein Z517_08243 [Fonsecaea pedrosoi CBS 271.37]